MIIFIFIFIFIIGLLIFVHELGHFIAAKRVGVAVEEFGLGFPPKLFSVKKGETIYSLNLLPLGGFVKLYGEDGNPAGDAPPASPNFGEAGGQDNSKSFAVKSVWQRSKIISAGVAMNLILGVVLLTVGYKLGLPTAVESRQVGTDTKVQIIAISPSSPAELVGLKMGDAIKELKTQNLEIKITDVKEFQTNINKYKGSEIELVVERGNSPLTFSLTPRENPPAGEGPIGVGLANVAIVAYPWYEAIIKAIVSVVTLVIAIFSALGSLLFGLFGSGHISADVTGPIGIFSLTEQFSKLGFVYLLQLMALLTVNLAVINILPFPALDGGRLLFLLIEKIKKSPVNQQTEKIINSWGFAFLILLMVIITFRDIIRLF